MTRIQTPIDHFFSFSMRIILYEQVSFFLTQAKLLSGFLLQQAQSVFFDITFVFFQKRFKRNERNPPGGKAVQVSDPAVGLCRKILRFAVRGTFEHKLFFVCWYPHRSTYLQVFSVARRSWTLNFKAKIASEHTRKKLKVGIKSARPYFPRRCSRVGVRSEAVPKNIQPAPTKCSCTTTLTSKLSSFGLDPRRSSNFSFWLLIWVGIEPSTSAGPDCCISWTQNCWKWMCGRYQRRRDCGSFQEGPAVDVNSSSRLPPWSYKYGGVAGVNTLVLAESLPMSRSVGTVLFENESHYVHLITSQYEYVVNLFFGFLLVHVKVNC